MSSNRSAASIARGKTRNLKSPVGVPDGSAIRRETKKVVARRALLAGAFLRELAELFEEQYRERVYSLASNRIRGGFIRSGSRAMVPLHSFLAKYKHLHALRTAQGLAYTIDGLETDLSDGQSGSDNYAHRVR